jgi:hypothetical protein
MAKRNMTWQDKESKSLAILLVVMLLCLCL